MVISIRKKVYVVLLSYALCNFYYAHIIADLENDPHYFLEWWGNWLF